MAPEKPTTAHKPNHIKDLALLLAAPAAITLIALALVYIPRLMANPAYDFIYSYCETYACRNSYEVAGDGRIVEQIDDDFPRTYNRSLSLRYYDAKTDSSRSLTLAEAGEYTLDSASKSPDGYILEQQNDTNGFLFWGDSRSGWRLKNGAKIIQVQLATNDSYYSNKITFLGWVK